MPSYLYGKDDRFYCAKQTSYSVIRNTEGAASLVGTDAARHSGLSAAAIRNRLPATDKESNGFAGYIDHTRKGRYAAGPVSVKFPLCSSSGAGVESDHGPIFEAAMGKATVAAATSVTYGPNGAKYMNEASPVTCELWGFNQGAELGVVAVGAIPNRLSLQVGQDSAEVSVDFAAYYALGQDRFANAETAEKCGLTAWPTEPATQTYAGAQLTGFTTLVTLDGIAYNVRGTTFTANLKRAYRMDKCAIDGTEYFPSDPFELTGEGGPEFLLDVDLWSTDSSDLRALRRKYANRTPFDGVIVIGSVAGGIWTINLNNLIRPGGDNDPVHEDGDDRKVVRLTGLRAQCTNTSARDECTIVHT